MSYEYETHVGMGTNGTSNVASGVHRLTHPLLRLATTIKTPEAPSSVTDWPMFNGGGNTDAPPEAPSNDDVEPAEDLTSVTEESTSVMPWVIGIGAVAALGVGGFFLWKYMSKDEEAAPAAL